MPSTTWATAKPASKRDQVTRAGTSCLCRWTRTASNECIKQDRRRQQSVCGHRGQGPVMPNPGPQHDLAVNQGQHDDRAAAESMAVGLTRSESLNQSRPVSTQRATIRPKNAWPVQPWTAARNVETWVTRVPPRIPWPITASRASDAEHLHPAPGLEAEEPDRQSDRRQAHGRPVESMGVLDPDAEGSIPEVVEEHVDPERCRPVRHCHPHAVGRHRAPDKEQGRVKTAASKAIACGLRRYAGRTGGAGEVVSGRHDHGFRAEQELDMSV